MCLTKEGFNMSSVSLFASPPFVSHAFVSLPLAFEVEIELKPEPEPPARARAEHQISNC